MVQEVKKKQKRKKKFCKNIVDARDETIDLFEKETFPFKGNVFKTKEEESEENRLEQRKDNYKKYFKYIEDKSIDINYELFKKHFNFKAPAVLAKKLYATKNTNKNNELVNVIKSGLIDLKDEIEKMSKEEIENEKPYKILKTVEDILKFNIEKQLGKA